MEIETEDGTHRRPAGRGYARLPIPAVLLILAVLLVAGCGSSSSPEISEVEPIEAAQPYEAEVTEEAEPEEASEPIESVGKMVVTDEKGTTFTDSFKLGPLGEGEEGAPPASVLSACNYVSRGLTATAAFARGEMSISYTEGTVPEYVPIPPSGIVQGEELYDALVAYELNDEWQCAQEELETSSWEFQPDETKAMPIWLLVGDVINNERPQVPAELYNSWYFSPIGVELRKPSEVTGPGAISCGKYESRLYLYKRSGHCQEEF
jgi:hypothetical protein